MVDRAVHSRELVVRRNTTKSDELSGAYPRVPCLGIRFRNRVEGATDVAVSTALS